MKGGNNCQENLFFDCTSASLMVMEGETIRINVKNKPPSGTGMLSPAGLLSGHPGTVKAKTLSIAPPPSGGVRIQSPLRPPLNDSAAAKMTLGRHNTTLKGPKEVARHSADPQADLSQLEKNLPTTTGTGSNKSTAAGWVGGSDLCLVLYLTR
ncbi:uncharacterized protein At1g03900-like isoform X2 [Coffea eugenioides]|nr:uncharacterized protein At1g03900-like isoform X2 [Coffea eugenioides]